MKQLNELIQSYQTWRKKYEQLKKLKAEAYNTLKELEQKIADEFNEQMIDQITVGERTVSAKFEPHYNITGGKIKAPENKIQVLSMLKELGYSDKISFHQTAEMPDNSFQAAMRKLPVETVQALHERGLISVSMLPKVRVTEKKQ